jgi:hypothetical protein
MRGSCANGVSPSVPSQFSWQLRAEQLPSPLLGPSREGFAMAGTRYF